MEHRHLHHSEWTLAAVDDAIARGRVDEWKELRDAAVAQAPVRDRILRVCASRIRPNSGTTSGTTMSAGTWPEWEHVLSVAAHVQDVLPGTTLVGGTAAAVYAGHRVSYDADDVLGDLRNRFDEVLAQLESVAGSIRHGTTGRGSRERARRSLPTSSAGCDVCDRS